MSKSFYKALNKTGYWILRFIPDGKYVKLFCSEEKKTVKRSHLNQNAINEIFDNFELSFKKLLLAFFCALVGAVYNYFLSFCREDQTLASITISFEKTEDYFEIKNLDNKIEGRLSVTEYGEPCWFDFYLKIPII